jgi:hypothetical protein
LSRDVMDDSSMQRVFTLPTTRSFTLAGTAVVSQNATDASVDRLLGIPDAEHGGITVSSKHPFGEPGGRASSALDGDARTAWNLPLGAKPQNEYVRVEVPAPVTFGHLDLALVEDGRHSIPTQIEITNEEGERRLVDVPRSRAKPDANGVVQERVSFPALRGRSLQFVVPKTAEVKRNDVTMPAAIAELGIPGVRRAAAPRSSIDTCTSDLIRVDGKPFPVRATGSNADAASQRQLKLEPCDPTKALALAAGTHEVDVAVSPHNSSGLDVTHLVLSSAAGGGAASAEAVGRFTPSDATPKMRVVKQGRASMTVEVDPTSKPFWFVLGESNNQGWTAKANGVRLGPSQLVDGYANGWQVTPTSEDQPVTITLDWTPQHTVWRALVLSALAGLLCVAIVAVGLVSFRRRRHAAALTSAADAPVFRVPLLEPAPLRSAVHSWLAVLIAGALAAVAVRPWVGILVAIATFFAQRSSRWRLVLRVTPAILIVGVAIGMAGAQTLRHYPLRFEWPTFFDWARYPVWIAIMLIVADVVISLVYREESKDPRSSD